MDFFSKVRNEKKYSKSRKKNTWKIERKKNPVNTHMVYVSVGYRYRYKYIYMHFRSKCKIFHSPTEIWYFQCKRIVVIYFQKCNDQWPMNSVNCCIAWKISRTKVPISTVIILIVSLLAYTWYPVSDCDKYNSSVSERETKIYAH